jgi:shikimate dehydrogenase
MKKYFVIGNPIGHSLSPKLHNHWLEQNNINAVYKKIKLEENEVENFIYEIKNQKINGCNVTVPFKKKVIPFLDKLSSEAEHTQSVNTICFHNGELVGHNTDIGGFEKAINSLDYKVKDKKILILGSGGVVPSLIFALNKMEASEITICNRTNKKAEDLKIQFNKINTVSWGEVPDFDMIINATSLGLNNETIDLNTSNIGQGKLFYDVIYNPNETNFLKLGKKLGNQIENGKLMFIYQAFEAFRLWHGVEPDVSEKILKLLDHD